MHEFPLVIFTLFMQASVGCLLFTLLCYFCAFRNNASVSSLITPPILASFTLGCIGLLGSLFHLGNPFHMFYTLLHASTSWMSREVWATILYMALLFFSTALLLLKQKANTPLLLLSAIAGIAYMYTMSALYADTLFILWGGVFTYVSFFGTVLLLGSVIAALLFMIRLRRLGLGDENQLKTIVKLALMTSLIGIIMLLLGALSLLGNMGEPIYMGITPRELPEGLLSLSLLRIVLIALGMLLIGRLLWQKAGQTFPVTAIMSLATLCIFAGEGVGRVLFFSLGG
ncbi:dimethyl sulfoxide reductase anchor subunit family protein [Providencia sp. SP181]|uniref:dimethyl sulfoxide reductase anchor subunit family protein n=1 Tax=Providencia sp. SP181 TaxID=3136277 RepID=UPI003D291D41